jgi:hypothetical protein
MYEEFREAYQSSCRSWTGDTGKSSWIPILDGCFRLVQYRYGMPVGNPPGIYDPRNRHGRGRTSNPLRLEMRLTVGLPGGRSQ